MNDLTKLKKYLRFKKKEGYYKLSTNDLIQYINFLEFQSENWRQD